MIAVILLFDVFSLLGQITNMNNSIIKNGRYLIRPGHGEGSREVELNVTMEKTEDGKAAKDSLTETQKITVTVDEQSYTESEQKEIFLRSFQYLKEEVLGANQSADLINSNLNFIKSVPETGISVKWEPEDYSLIQTDGTVKNENISAEGVDTTVAVILSYQKQQEKYSMSFHIMPMQHSEEDTLRQKLEEEIRTYSQKTADKDYLELPEACDTYKLYWNDSKENKNNTILLLGVIAVIAVWLISDQELDKQMKKRKEQMLFDYPEIINKFTLLVNAGMTVKQAWNRVAMDYSGKYSLGKSRKRYAYEEMLTTANELKLGMPENIAYEQYGRRIGLIPYIKFSSLISQNLKKGNKGFTDLLMREAIESFEDRKEVAKRLGEEAGTKLLIPMAFMLIIVLLIIMIPAFWSFRI
jgi:hypothetical protein